MKQLNDSRIPLFVRALVLAGGVFSTSSFAFNPNTVTDPFMVIHVGVFGLDAKHVEVNKAKVSAGTFGLALKTPTMCFPTLGCLPQLGTGWLKVHYSRSTVTKGGSTVSTALVNVPNLKITQETKWPAGNSKVRIRLVVKLGNAQNTKTYWRTPQ